MADYLAEVWLGVIGQHFLRPGMRRVEGAPLSIAGALGV